MPKKKLKLEQIWSQVPTDYYQKGILNNPFQRYWHTQKVNNFQRIIKYKKFLRICDAGCASGQMTLQISRFFPKSKVMGLDGYAEAISYAEKAYKNIEFLHCDLHNIPIKNKFFDLVVCYETIEHVLNPKEVLKEIKRISKDDATIILAMDSGSWLFRIVWFIWEKTKGKVWQNAHLHPFKKNQLKKLLQEEGFDIQQEILSHFGMEVTFVLKKSSV